MTYTYTLYGLTLSVPFRCTILPLAPANAVPDITIVEGSVPRNLVAPKIAVQNWEADPGCFLLRGGRLAGRFLVENGQKITLHRNPAAEDELLCANLTTGVIAALLCQRGQLVLHANVVMTPRGAVAISGESGAGKSTTQAALLARGCQMISDDVTVLRLESDGQVMVLPGVSKINLCEDAAIKLGHDICGLQRNPLLNFKVIIPVDHCKMVTVPFPLKGLYLLNRHPGKGMNIKPLTGAEKFLGLQGCIYGPLFPEEHPGMFSCLRALAEQVDMIRIERPATGCSVSKVAEAILHG